MAASGIEILQGQLDQLKAQREEIYTQQLLPLDDAIGHLEKLVSGQNGKVKSAPAETPTPTKAAPAEAPTPAKATTNGAKSRQGKRSAAKAAPTKTAKAPAKQGKAPAKGAAPAESQAPVTPAPQPDTQPAPAPEATKPAPKSAAKAAPKQAAKAAPKAAAKTAPTKKPTVKLKPNYRDKSVDDAIAALLNAEPSKTWKTEDVVSAIAAPSSKAELNTYIRSLRLYLANGAAQGKWKKLSDGPAVYAANDYKAG